MAGPPATSGVRRWMNQVGDAVNRRLDRAGRVLMELAAIVDFVEDLGDLSRQSKSLAKDARSLVLERPRGQPVLRTIEKLERLCFKMETLEAKYRSKNFTNSVLCLLYRRRLLRSVRTIRSVIAEYHRREPSVAEEAG